MSGRAPINPITGSPDRTTSFERADQVALAAGLTPGAGGAIGATMPAGINPQAAMNAQPQRAIYFARNNSNILPHRIIKYPVNDSMMHLPEAVIKHYKLETHEIINLSKTRDMNIYASEVQAVRKGLKLDNRIYIIEPGEAGKHGAWQAIPEGLWDLYCGNWDRMHSPDAKVREQETTKVRNFAGDFQPVYEEGNEAKRDPSAYIEFRRQLIDVQMPQAGGDRVFAEAGVEI